MGNLPPHEAGYSARNFAARGTPLTRHTEIIAAWQNVGMTENAVNTAVTSASSPAIPAETSAVPPATRTANRPLGTPLGKHPTRVLFLGAGELGKEVTLELMRLGAWVCAADS